MAILSARTHGQIVARPVGAHDCQPRDLLTGPVTDEIDRVLLNLREAVVGLLQQWDGSCTL